MSRYYVYILKCSDKTFYTGWTSEIEKRIQEHNHGTCGAKYTRARRPVKLVYVERCPTPSDALKREAQIKKLSHEQKLRFVGTVRKVRKPTTPIPRKDADEDEI